MKWQLGSDYIWVAVISPKNTSANAASANP